MNIDKKHFTFILIITLFVVLSLESILYLLAFANFKVDSLLAPPKPNKPNSLPRTSAPHTIPDDRLGYRPNPKYPGHDTKGFRNQKHLIKADIVALGDSQTYGTGVDSEEAWPRQLEFLTANVVYNMAYGGYGPVHSLILWDEAIALEPKIIIEAFYAGNDLYDSFRIVYNRGQHPELKSSDVLLQESIQKAEQSESIASRVSKIMGATPKLLPIRGFFSRHSKVYGLMRRIRYELMLARTIKEENQQKPKKEQDEEWVNAKEFAKKHSAYCQVFQDGTFKTIFMSERRLSALDFRDPRIIEGHRISLNAISRMNDLAVVKDIKFLTILIPTKELVFREKWVDSSVNYRTLVENEEHMWKLTKDFLKKNNIEYIDALPTLRRLLSSGIQPYKVSRDGHPNQQGHIAIARLVANHIE